MRCTQLVDDLCDLFGMAAKPPPGGKSLRRKVRGIGDITSDGPLCVLVVPLQNFSDLFFTTKAVEAMICQPEAPLRIPSQAGH